MILNGCPSNHGGRCFVNGYEDCDIKDKCQCQIYKEIVWPMEARIEPLKKDIRQIKSSLEDMEIKHEL